MHVIVTVFVQIYKCVSKHKFVKKKTWAETQKMFLRVAEVEKLLYW